MKQSRLKIIPRKISEDEINVRSNFDSKARSIKEAYKYLKEFEIRMRTAQQAQQDRDLQIGEVAISDELILQRIAKQKQQIKIMEQELKELQDQKFKAQQSQRMQTTMLI